MFYVIVSIIFILFIIGFIKCRKEILDHEIKISKIEKDMENVEESLKYFYDQYQQDKK